VLRNLVARHQIAAGNGNPVTYRVRINGIDTPMVVTIPTAVVVQAFDLLNTAAIAQGDIVTLQATKLLALGGGGVQPVCTMELT
jgi:hypothetical protein